MDLRISILGGYSLFGTDGKPMRLPTRKCWALLAYLAMSGGREISREELSALLWPLSSDPSARASLRQELAVLRKIIAAAGLPEIQGTKELVRFDIPAELIDAAHAARLIQAATPDALRSAVACYKGEFLSGLNVLAHPFEDWLWVERMRIKALMQDAYLQLLKIDTEGGDAQQAIATAKGLLKVEPTQEQGHRALMRLYVTIGRRAEALQQFQRCVDILRHDLDAEPSVETSDLADSIRANPSRLHSSGGGPRSGKLLAAPKAETVSSVILVAAGLAGVLDLKQDLDPRMLGAARDQFHARFTQLIVGHGGQLIAGGGQIVLAAFGFPETSAADPGHAISAAQAIVAEEFGVTPGMKLRPVAGIDCGPVLIRAHPMDPVHAEVIGVAPYRAATLAQSAKGGEVVISDDLRRHIGLSREPVKAPSGSSGDAKATTKIPY